MSKEDNIKQLQNNWWRYMLVGVFWGIIIGFGGCVLLIKILI